MTPPGCRRIVVVGGSIAALSAVEELRARGSDAAIHLVSEEERLPYERPPLSKGVLTCGEEPIEYRDEAWFADNGVELHLGQRATGLDARRQVVEMGDEQLRYDALVVATGARPRNPWAACELEGVLTLRTIGDGHALRGLFGGRPRVVVVGAGLIGAEVASSARTLGCEVTILEAAPSPLARSVGEAAGRRLARLHHDRGVVLRCGVQVTGIGGRDRVELVETADGEKVPADVVVVGVGVVPNVDWLFGSGLRVGDGVLCDGTLSAGPPGVYAAGDAARFVHPVHGPIRTEQWTMAAMQGRHAAANLLRPAGQAQPFTAPPYFWSDQYGSRLQMVGVAAGGDLIDLGRPAGPVPVGDGQSGDGQSGGEGRPGEGRWAVGWSRDGRLTGVLALDWPERIASLRGAVARRDRVDALVAAASTYERQNVRETEGAEP